MKIAAVTDETGLATTLFDKAEILIYSNENGAWEVTGELTIKIGEQQSIAAAREAFREVANAIGNAKAIVCSSISGIPYQVFDVAGFSIFELTGPFEDHLDFIAHELVKEEQAGHMGNDYPTGPVESGSEGKFRINLIELQGIRPGISSKKALLPFFESTPFFELEVVCGHVPPWFDRELINHNLVYEATKLPGGDYVVKIVHRICT